MSNIIKNGVKINSEDVRDISTLINNYNELLNAIQSELNFYKVEHEKIKKEVVDVIGENRKLALQFKNINFPQENILNISTGEEEKCTEEVIKNLQTQNQFLQEEKKCLEKLWRTSQQTIENLEKEIIEYRKYLSQPDSILKQKQNFAATIKLLENNISTLNNEIIKQKAINKCLLENKNENEHKLQEGENKYQEILLKQDSSVKNFNKTENLLTETKTKVENVMKENNHLKELLEKSNTVIKEYMVRETKALNKVQEALHLAEMAITEKNDAITKKQEIKEEFDYLVSTISQVMEEAATKVENDMEAMKLKYKEKIQYLEQNIKKLTSSLENERKNSSMFQLQVQNLEGKLKEVVESNKAMDTDLQIASQSIIEMELKVEAFEKLLNRGQETNKFCEERTIKLQEFLESNRLLKERWKTIASEVTTKLQAEIKDLQIENTNLQTENTHLRDQLRL